MSVARLLLLIVSQAPSDNVSFDLAKNIIVVRGTLNGSAATFILDTGAGVTVITPDAAQKAGVAEGVCRSIGIGESLIRDLPVEVADPPQAHFLRASGVDYHGILGTSYLEKFVVTLDYAASRVSLTPADKAPALRRPAGGWLVSFELRRNVIVAQGKLNEQGPQTFIVDTGAGETIISPQTAKRLGVVGKPIRAEAGFDAELARLESIALGEARTTALEAVLYEPPQLAGLRRAGIAFDGLLGYTFLARFRTTIDYRTKQIALVPAGYDDRAPLGMTLRGTRVTEVTPGGPAERSGFKVGDVIEAVNDQRVRLIDEIRIIVGGTSTGSTLVFTVKRGDKQLALKVTR